MKIFSSTFDKTTRKEAVDALFNLSDIDTEYTDFFMRIIKI